MSKRSLLNIEGAFGMTNSDISALRAQIDAGERLVDDKLNKNYDLIKLPNLDENETLQELINEVKEVVAEDFDFVLDLAEKNDEQYSIFGRKIEPQQSDLLSSINGADLVCVVALNGVGEDAPRLVMDLGDAIPNSLGELRTNEFLAFPAWVPYGWTRNHTDEPLYTIELFFNIVGTKSDEEIIARAQSGSKPEPIVTSMQDIVDGKIELDDDED